MRHKLTILLAVLAVLALFALAIPAAAQDTGDIWEIVIPDEFSYALAYTVSGEDVSGPTFSWKLVDLPIVWDLRLKLYGDLHMEPDFAAAKGYSLSTPLKMLGGNERLYVLTGLTYVESTDAWPWMYGVRYRLDW